MSKAVFIESSHSHYADRPGEVYHFPNSYLSRVAQTVGDWVIFYEGRRGDGKGYHRVQKVAAIRPDPTAASHSFAILDRGSALDFETNLPRQRAGKELWESGLAWVGGNNTSAIRLISDEDFGAIINAGLSYEPAPDALPRQEDVAGFAETQASFAGPLQHDRTRILSSRLLRDQSFARSVRRAYGGRCAISGLELRNGGGRPEVEAAHILPVAKRGPDTVNNGLALSAPFTGCSTVVCSGLMRTTLF
ncbi:HNH endonuclease [Paracoccus aminovorans]|uniref:HNH endonuclease n=1 Tax=Paracoccus aminovorans TaxID=34004 RepID=UPI002B25E59D|nr:HNH endonuclease [Paracoccus aminovorans]